MPHIKHGGGGGDGFGGLVADVDSAALAAVTDSAEVVTDSAALVGETPSTTVLCLPTYDTRLLPDAGSSLGFRFDILRQAQSFDRHKDLVSASTGTKHSARTLRAQINVAVVVVRTLASL